MKTKSSNEPQLRLIKEILFGTSPRLPVADDPFWQDFIAQCQRERVEGAVYYRLKKTGLDVALPTFWRENLAGCFRRNLVANLIFISQSSYRLKPGSNGPVCRHNRPEHTSSRTARRARPR